ncbi:hypothetical protein OG21DRAFT_1037759 [Imleria badia]|nr:hypothetical protein OG21DRAFT_1037759 [Imleria badia]
MRCQGDVFGRRSWPASLLAEQISSLSKNHGLEHAETMSRQLSFNHLNATTFQYCVRWSRDWRMLVHI